VRVIPYASALCVSSVLQCVAACCSVLQCVAVCCSFEVVCLYTYIPCISSACYTFCVSIVCQQCVAVCCSALQCVSVCCSFNVVCLYVYTVHQQCVLYILRQHCVSAVCCSVLQCVAVRCSVFQCVAVLM